MFSSTGFSSIQSRSEEPQWGSGLPSLAAAAVVRRLKHGETLCAEGEQSRYCYEIVQGVMKEYTTLENGQREISDFYWVGDIVGIGARAEQAQTIEAVTDCAVRCIPQDMLHRNARTSPEAHVHLMGILFRRLDRSRARAMLISRKRAGERVAEFLRNLAMTQGTVANVKIVMSRQDIADYLGLTIETVCRSMTELKNSGAIAMPTARTFTVVDHGALAHAAGHHCTKAH
jgi:CRP-like cAMP-binding protein